MSGNKEVIEACEALGHDINDLRTSIQELEQTIAKLTELFDPRDGEALRKLIDSIRGVSEMMLMTSPNPPRRPLGRVNSKAKKTKTAGLSRTR